MYIYSFPSHPTHLFQGTEVRDRHLEGKIGLLSSTCILDRKKKKSAFVLIVTPITDLERPELGLLSAGILPSSILII